MSSRTQCTQLLKACFSGELYLSRKSLKFTQAQMAQRLCMDERSYVNLEHGESCCGGLTLLLFLIYCCEDVPKFLETNKILIESALDWVA